MNPDKIVRPAQTLAEILFIEQHEIYLAFLGRMGVKAKILYLG